MSYERKRTNLCGEWKLCHQLNSEYLKSTVHPTTVEAICAEPTCIPAVVPGNFEIDLQRANKIGDPFFGQNVLKMQK